MLIMEGKTHFGHRVCMYSTRGYYVVIFYYQHTENTIHVYPKNETGTAMALEMFHCCD